MFCHTGCGIYIIFFFSIFLVSCSTESAIKGRILLFYHEKLGYNHHMVKIPASLCFYSGQLNSSFLIESEWLTLRFVLFSFILIQKMLNVSRKIDWHDSRIPRWIPLKSRYRTRCFATRRTAYLVNSTWNSLISQLIYP